MKAALNNGSSGSEFVVFAGAGHVFHTAYRPSCDGQAARDGWQRTLAWLEVHGVG